MIENYQKRIDKIVYILVSSLKKYREKTTIEYYEPVVIKSGIEKFEDTKVYIDTSSISGVNNIFDGEIITFKNKPSRANMQPIVSSVWFAKMKNSDKKLVITEKDIDLIGDYVLSTGFLGIKTSDKLPLSFLVSIVLSESFNEQRDLYSTGTTMAAINNKSFLSILVPKLSEEEIFSHSEKYSLLVDELSLLRRKINSLKNIKSNLLNKYF